MERLHQRHVNLAAPLEDLNRVTVHVVFHGCGSMRSAMEIAGGGFAALPKTDLGYFGAGLYFTHDLDYALSYGRVVLVCLVCFGNPYPITEAPFVEPLPEDRVDFLVNPAGFLGRALVSRHDAHVTFVRGPDFHPAPPGTWGSSAVFSEIVLGEAAHAHVLPLGVLDWTRGSR